MHVPSQKIHHYLTLLLAFCIPLDRRIAPILIALLLINWVLDWNWKEKLANYKIHKTTLLPAVLYLLYCVGMLYSENLSFGLKDLETKMSLMLLPIIYASHRPVEGKDFNQMMRYFVVGNLLAAVLCLGHSAYVYFNEMYLIDSGQLNNVAASPKYFFSSDLSYFMHPSYFSMYLCVAMTYLLIRSTTSALSKKSFVLLIAGASLLTIIIFLLSSKIGIIISLAIWATYLIFLITLRRWYWQGILMILSIGTLSYFLIKSSDILDTKFKDLASAVNAAPGDSSLESSAVRISVWKASKEIIAEMPLTGYGTGDIHSVLGKKYLEYDMKMAHDKRLNTHNQFFQTGITIGWTGIIFLIISLIVPILRRPKSYISLHISFSIIIILNLLVESMFEVQAGVVFFSFFHSLLSITSNEQA